MVKPTKEDMNLLHHLRRQLLLGYGAVPSPMRISPMC